jgi:hypothetical protein
MTTEKTFEGVTLHGFPVRIELQWPFRLSEGGSDWYVVHGTVGLADGGPLHADIALNLAQTINEVLPALDSDLAFWVAINTARKALDGRQVAFWKHPREQKFNASYIDHGYCFNAGEWSFPDAPLRGVFGRNDVYASITGWDGFEPG